MRNVSENELMNIGGGHTCYGVLVRLGDFSACLGYLD